MKGILITVVATFWLATMSFGQSFKGHLSATFGVLNPKVRVQYERPLKERASIGVNVNYYFVNWTGVLAEPFIRVYGKRDGNAEGFFGQAKLMYGNLSTLDYQEYQSFIENERWSTFGLGLNMGYKFLLGSHFTIESLFGFRFLTPPTYKYRAGYSEEDLVRLGEGIGWYVTTGLPVDFQVKFGYQF